MICFPNAKINLGLHILEKRSDNYHNIETLFYPIGLKDILECVPVDNTEHPLIQLSGIPLEGNPGENLVIKAYKLLQKITLSKPFKSICISPYRREPDWAEVHRMPLLCSNF